MPIVEVSKGNKEWKPHTRQEEFLQLPFSIFEGFFGGAAGPGKTECLMMIPIVYGFYRHPQFKGLILRRTFPDLEKEFISRSQEYYPLTGGKYNEQKRRWRWPSGAILQFGHMEHEKDKANYDGAEYNFIGFDELTHFTESQYLYVTLSRARSSSPDLPAIVRSASNPGNIGHSWVRKRFIEPAKEGRRIIIETVTDFTGKRVENKRIFIPAYATDNPTLLQNDPGYLARMEMMPENERRAKVYGDWWLFAGQVFTEFRSEKLPGEPPNALHVIEPFRIPEWYPRIAHFDWGTTAATAGYWGAVAPDNRVIVYREYHEKGKRVSDWGNAYRELSIGESIRRVGLCHSAFANRGEEHTLAEQFAHFAGVEPYNSGRDRVGGKMLLHEFLRWKPLERSPLTKDQYDEVVADRLFRFYGAQKYKDYVKMFEKPPEEKNLPKLLIFNTCKQLINCIPLCSYDDTNKEDVADFEGDDPYDSLRGLLKMVDAFANESVSEMEKSVKYQSAVEFLAATGDQTSYHRRMEAIDRTNKTAFGVRRRSAIRRR
jgi:hypothetical protein